MFSHTTEVRKGYSIVAPDTIVGRERELDAVSTFLNGESQFPQGSCSSKERRGSARPPSGARRLVSPGPTPVCSWRGRPKAKAKLSFSVLTDLFEPTLSEMRDQLPVPQRRALEAALMLRAPVAGGSRGRSGRLTRHPGGPSVARRAHARHDRDRRRAMDGRPVRALPVVRSPASAGTNTITVIAASRIAPGLHEPIGLAKIMTFQELELGPLSTDALARSLRQLEAPFSRPLIKRIHEASGGNPFYALEIGRALVRSSSPAACGGTVADPG